METNETHPIDIAEVLAEFHNWDFERTSDDQISMCIEAQWRNYMITIVWSAGDETLRIISTFEIIPSEERLLALYEMLNLANEQIWTGNFTFWSDNNLMVWRYGLSLTGEQIVNQKQIDRMIQEAVSIPERFFPAFQLVLWGDETPEQAIGIAMAEAYGRA